MEPILQTNAFKN